MLHCRQIYDPCVPGGRSLYRYCGLQCLYYSYLTDPFFTVYEVNIYFWVGDPYVYGGGTSSTYRRLFTSSGYYSSPYLFPPSLSVGSLYSLYNFPFFTLLPLHHFELFSRYRPPLSLPPTTLYFNDPIPLRSTTSKTSCTMSKPFYNIPKPSHTP